MTWSDSYDVITDDVIVLMYVPSSHSSVDITFFIQIGNEGSIIAIPMFANVIEPETRVHFLNCIF